VNFWAISLDHQGASLEQRVEAIPFLRSDSFAGLRKQLSESLTLSTCNRVELYGLGVSDHQSCLKSWQDHFEVRGVTRPEFQIYQGKQALNHLLRVTASLESMVLGETQITGQVRRAYEQANQDGQVGNHFHRFFQTALRVAKRVRSETEVGQFSVSLPSVGVKLAERVMGDLSERKVGILGLGEIGRVAAEHFGSVEPKKLFLFNRTRSKAEEFSSRLRKEEVHCELVDSVEALFQSSEIVVSAVSTQLVDETQLRSWVETRKTPVFVLDLSVPPSIPSIQSENFFFFSVDDLKKISEENSQLRRQETEKAERIILGELEKSWQSLENRSVDEVFRLLGQKVEVLRKQELEALRLRLSADSAKDWVEIDRMSKRLADKILQDPILEMKWRTKEAESDETWLEFFKNLFKI